MDTYSNKMRCILVHDNTITMALAYSYTRRDDTASTDSVWFISTLEAIIHK